MLAATDSSGVASGAFFIVQWVLILGGATIHVLVDRHRHRRTGGRVVELYLLWILAAGGAWAVFGGFGHIGPNSTEIAEQIGYDQSMFQWEVGWGDIALGVLGIGCIWKRDSWLTAAVVALVIMYGGDAIGHIMQYVEHDNTEPNNVWAIPSDILQPVLAVVLFAAYRRRERTAPTPAVGG